MSITSVITERAERVNQRVKRYISRRMDSRLKKIILPEGGVMWWCGVGWLAKEAQSYESLFMRDNARGIRSNIFTKPMYAMKTLTRDYVLEQMLQSGKWTFQNFFVVRNPFGEAPLTALALFSTEKMCRVRVTVKGDIPKTDFVSELPPAKNHRVPILGLYPARENIVILELLDESGNFLDKHKITIPTKEVATYLRDAIQVKRIDDDPAFENILISGGLNMKTCVFDRQGKIRYYLRRPVRGYGIFPMKNGHFFYMEKEIGTPSYSNPQCVMSYDMDYMGRVFQCYLTKDGVHHTVEEKEGGNLLAGSNTMMEHTEDMVIELDRRTGEVVWSITMEELFDEYYQDMMDWAHVNSAVYYEKDRSILLSLRNIHTVCLVDYDTKKLRWMLSDPDFWEKTKMKDKLLKPKGDVPWVYQQHAAYELDIDFDGNPHTKHILVFDNHWAKRRKAKSFDDDPLSYVSIYTVDEEKYTVSLYRRFGFPKTRIRANGILCQEKNRIYAMAASYAEPIGENQGGVYEFDFDTGEIVSEFMVKPGYFRAYPFEPDVIGLTKPVIPGKDYVGGELRTPQKVEENIPFRLFHKVSNPDILLVREEEILEVRGVDHQILAVYFVGKEETYAVRFDDTYQTMDIFADNIYYIAMQFHTLPEGRYHIYLDVAGDIQNTGKWVQLDSTRI